MKTIGRNNLYIYLTLAFIFAFFGCSPEYIKNIKNKKDKSLKAPFVVIIDENNIDKIEGEYIGDMYLDNSGIVNECSYDEVMGNIFKAAKNNGANIIKINSQEPPSFFSSCHKINASFYYSDNPKKYENEIIWLFDRKLEFDDFKAVVPNNKTHIGAKASFGLFYEISQSSLFASTKIKVKAKFYSDKSWMKSSSKNDNSLMRLQQLHFDIAELHARMLRKKLKDKNLKFTNMDKAKTVFAEIMTKFEEMQKKCDSETEWGMNEKKLSSWESNIKDELYMLDEYKDLLPF